MSRDQSKTLLEKVQTFFELGDTNPDVVEKIYQDGNIVKVEYNHQIFEHPIEHLPFSIDQVKTYIVVIDWDGYKNIESPGYFPKIANISGINIFTESYLIDSSITRYKNLEELRLYGAYAQDNRPLIPSSFTELTKLREITIDGSALLQDEISRLCELPQLEYLKLYIDLPSQPDFSGMSNIKQLIICDFNLSSFPMSIFNLTTLEHLDLSSCCINKLPTGFENLSELTKLILTRNKIDSVDQSIGKLDKLTHLDLSNNQLQKLPPTLSALTQLEFLNVSNNRLNELPKKIGNLTNLIECNFSNNELTRLPRSMCNLRYLQHLDVTDNYIKFIPDCFKIYDNLTIELRGNENIHDRRFNLDKGFESKLTEIYNRESTEHVEE